MRAVAAAPQHRLHNSDRTLHSCPVGERYYAARAAGNREQMERIDNWLSTNPYTIPTIPRIFGEPSTPPATSATIRTTSAYERYAQLAAGANIVNANSTNTDFDSIIDDRYTEYMNHLIASIRASRSSTVGLSYEESDSEEQGDGTPPDFRTRMTGYTAEQEEVLTSSSPIIWLGKWQADADYVAGNVVSYEQEFWIAKKRVREYRPRENYNFWGAPSRTQYDFLMDIFDRYKQNNDVTRVDTPTGRRAIKL